MFALTPFLFSILPACCGPHIFNSLGYDSMVPRGVAIYLKTGWGGGEWRGDGERFYRARSRSSLRANVSGAGEIPAERTRQWFVAGTAWPEAVLVYLLESLAAQVVLGFTRIASLHHPLLLSSLLFPRLHLHNMYAFFRLLSFLMLSFFMPWAVMGPLSQSGKDVLVTHQSVEPQWWLIVNGLWFRLGGECWHVFHHLCITSSSMDFACMFHIFWDGFWHCLCIFDTSSRPHTHAKPSLLVALTID